ncbi:MAG: CapA family protein [Eggerthellaceae bacterium]|nr:CapA family protein [Eggerthellaceae bacterium]
MTEKMSRIRLGFVGDVCLADNYTPVIALDEIGSTDVTDGVDARFVDLMHGMDLMWANNEFCYSDRGERMPNKQFAFRAKTANVRYLADLGVNVAGLANNHVFDFGEQAFLDTLDTLESAHIPYVGAGRDLAAAQAPVYLQAGGLTVAYVAASRAEKIRMTPEATDTTPGILLCYDNSRFIASIREAAAHADYVVALPHWGTERATDLEDAQTHGARAYIDAGADAVIGTHAHCLQGIEFYKGKPILYNLGNFWFDGFKGLTVLAELQLPAAAERAGRGVDPSAVRLVLHPGWQQMAITSWIDDPTDRANAFRYIERISVNATIDETGFVRET